MRQEIVPKQKKGKASEIRIIDLSNDDAVRATYLKLKGLIA
jgi:hypothetical protein